MNRAKGRRWLTWAVTAVIVIGGAAAIGRAMLGSATRSGSSVGTSKSAEQGAGQNAVSGTGQSAASSAGQSTGHGAPAELVNPGATRAGAPTTPASPAKSLASPIEPVGPDIVRTATAHVRVDAGTVSAQMSKIAGIAAQNGGYVEGSNLAGGTGKTAPTTGQIVVRVDSADFTSVLSQLSGLGRITFEQVSGQDVTGQVGENAATIAVLQQEVSLLQSKLSQATDINTFLQIEGQLAPVQQQLQQLQSQQAVLQGSVVFASLTVDLAAPGAPAAPVPQTPAKASAASVAWHYATQNTLLVLDGLAVVVGWALPLLVLGGIVWFVVTRVMRRRRPGISAA